MNQTTARTTVLSLSPLRLIAAAALTATLAACASGSGNAPMAPSSSAPRPMPAPATPVTPNAMQDAARQLPAYFWDLSHAYDARGERRTDLQLQGRAPVRVLFDEQTLSVHNLCNLLNMGYTLEGNQMRLGRGASTMRACSDNALMQLDQRVGSQLAQVERYTVRSGATAGTAPTLVLHLADGGRWELTGTATPATRYGSAGERVFLEVAPQRVACNHPAMRNTQCLNVRDVRYADNGGRQSTGAWAPFHGEIEGYRHEAGTRNVLRLQRFALGQTALAPSNGLTHAYVLDMVVESGRAP